MSDRFKPIDTAPRDGTPIRIRGRRFHTEARYYATAIWAKRRCPAECSGWFPPGDKHDGKGPYEAVDGWTDLETAKAPG